MTHLSEEDRTQIEELFGLDSSSLDWKLTKILNRETRENIESVIREAMAKDGKDLPGPFDRYESRYGGEFAIRVRDSLMSIVAAEVNSLHDSLYETVCVGWNYCAKRKEKKFQTEEVTLSIAIADILLSAATQIPLPVTLISVYLVKRGVLDKWCKCGQSAPMESADEQ